MTLLQTLRKTIARELNLLYTTAPFLSGGELDCGWFCREHALHTHMLSVLFGADSQLCSGHYHVVAFGEARLTTFGDEKYRHEWARVKGIAPVDLSMTFQHFARALHFSDLPQFGGPIIGTGGNGDYNIVYSYDEKSAMDYSGIESIVFFVEREVLEFPFIDLLHNPYLFIHPPNLDDPMTWDTVFGSDIYAKVTLHCFSVATGSAKALFPTHDGRTSIRWISENYNSAVVTLTDLFKKRA